MKAIRLHQIVNKRAQEALPETAGMPYFCRPIQNACKTVHYDLYRTNGRPIIFILFIC